MLEGASSLSRIITATLGVSVPILARRALGDLDRGTVDEHLERWSRALLDALGVRVRVRGAEHLRRWRAAIVMSNHQSHYDIPVLFQVIPPSLRMVAKAELERIPIWGSAMRAAGMVFIDRRDRAAAIRSLSAAQRQLGEGVSVWIAPEGTRSLTGALGPFKKGGFVLAEEVGVDILPLTISGTRDVLPARSRRPRRGVDVTLTVHPRVSPRDFDGRAALISAVRDAIASGLPDQRPAENGHNTGAVW